MYIVPLKSNEENDIFNKGENTKGQSLKNR